MLQDCNNNIPFFSFQAVSDKLGQLVEEVKGQGKPLGCVSMVTSLSNRCHEVFASQHILAGKLVHQLVLFQRPAVNSV